MKLSVRCSYCEQEYLTEKLTLSEREKMKTMNEVLIEALKFYADDSVYTRYESLKSGHRAYQINIDGGKIARAAISGLTQHRDGLGWRDIEQHPKTSDITIVRNKQGLVGIASYRKKLGRFVPCNVSHPTHFILVRDLPLPPHTEDGG